MTNMQIDTHNYPGATPSDAAPTLQKELQRELEAAGCFRRAPWACGFRMAWVAAAYGFGFAVLLADPDWLARFGALALVAFASVQAGFIAHDAGDGAITRNRALAFLLGQFFMTLMTSLSASYFHYFHRLHHADLSDDAAKPRSASIPLNRYEGKFVRKLVSRNGLLFMCVMVCLRGLSFKLESLRYMARNARATRIDQVFLALHGALWFGLPLATLGVVDVAVNYALVTLLAGPYIGTVLLLNHSGMVAARAQSDIPVMQRITMATRNLGASRWNDFIFGGVNNHIEHHLFPDIPTPRLPRARAITREFCRRHGVAYQETGYFRALAEVARYFRGLPQHRLASESLT